MRKILTILPVALVLAACAVIPEEERRLMQEDIDCDRADQQIAALTEARPSDLRKVGVAASSLGAGGLAVMIARRDVGDRERILSGEYEEEIDTRIALIRETCGIPAPPAPVAGEG